jgi:preprotein translocase subunit SecA
MLNIVDSQWKDHLQAIDHLKEWINQMGYAQKDPLVEYKKQSFDLFEAMLDRIDIETARSLYHLQVAVEEPPEQRLQRRPRRGQMTFTKANAPAARIPASRAPSSAISRKSDVTIHVPAAQAKNIRNVMALKAEPSF